MANVLSTTRKFKSKAIVLKGESIYGVDAAPTGAANYMEARNVSVTAFEVETVDRNIEQSTMGNGGKIIAGLWSKLSFDVALAASGTAGMAPKWAPVLLGCGYAETQVAATSVTYNLVSTGQGSVTAYLNIDGINYKFFGCRGEAKFKIDAKGIPTLSFELTALYTLPVDAAMPTLTKTGWAVEQAVNAENTGYLAIGAVNLPFSTFEFAAGNKISKINLPGPQREAVIVDRSPTCNVTVLAPALAVFDPYTLASNATAMTLTNSHGTGAGSRITSAIKGVIVGIAEDQIDGMTAYKLTVEPIPNSGNDEITLTLT